MKNLITLSIFLCFGFYSFAQSPIFGKWYLSRVLPNGEGYCFVRNQTASKYFFELPKDSAAKIILNLPNDSIIGLADRYSLIDTAAYLKDYQSNFSFNDTRSLRKLSIVFYDKKFRYSFMDYLFNDSLIITRIIKDKNSIIEDYKWWKDVYVDCPKIRKQEQEKLELQNKEIEKFLAEETKRIKKIYPDSIIPESIELDPLPPCDYEYKRKEPIFFCFATQNVGIPGGEDHFLESFIDFIEKTKNHSKSLPKKLRKSKQKISAIFTFIVHENGAVNLIAPHKLNSYEAMIYGLLDEFLESKYHKKWNPSKLNGRAIIGFATVECSFNYFKSDYPKRSLRKKFWYAQAKVKLINPILSQQSY